MSTDWAELSTAEEAVSRFPDWPDGKRVASITAGDYWDLGQSIEFTPTDGTQQYHRKKTDSKRKKLAKKARVLIPGAST